LLTSLRSAVAEFFDRDAHGIPRAWLKRIRHSMMTLVPQFSTDRMVAEYVRKYYLSGAAGQARR
jgi:starch phosphorylase